MDFNPLSGRQETQVEQRNEADNNVLSTHGCEKCGETDPSKLHELEVTRPPVDKEHFITDSVGPVACSKHREVVRLNHQCCQSPEYKVHTADAAADVVEVVECKSCGNTREYAPRPK